MSVDNVTDITPRVQYTALLGQTAFPYPFPIFEDSDLVVDVDGVTKALSTHYTVDGEGGDTGGNATFVTPMAGDEVVTIYRDIPIERTTDFQTNGPNSSRALNDELDKFVMIQQQLESLLSRTIRVPVTSSQPSNDLELGAAFEGNYLFINANGELEPATAIATTTLSKSILAALLNAQTSAETTAGSTPKDFYFPVFFVSRYYQVAHGTDYSIAAQAAVNAAAVGGGTVEFDNLHTGRWGFSSQVTVSSLYPVNILGHMNCTPNAAVEQGQYIAPNNNISGDIIKYVSPTASPNAGGGGIVRGLSFFDDSDPTNATIANRRVKTVNAALGLDAFSESKVVDCYFHYINGSAIRAKYAVMTDFVSNVIRYCGDTGKPAFDHPSGVGNVMQSCSIDRCRLEVNFDEPYIYVHGNTNSKDNKITACGFESETSEATSSQFFIDYNADVSKIATCHFNRQLATYAVRLSGDDNEIIGCSAESGAGAFATLTGNRNTITGGKAIADTSTIATLAISGQDCNVFALNMYFANAISITGVRTIIDGIKMTECTSADYLISSNAADTQITGCTLRNNNGQRAVTPSGISVTSSGDVSHNVLRGNNGTTGINVGSSLVRCTHNDSDGFTTEINPNGHMTDSIIERNFGFVTEAKNQAQVASGATSVVVSHGLDFTPTLQMIATWPLSTWGSTTKWWISTATATQFTINVDIAPGGSGMFFGWKVSPR